MTHQTLLPEGWPRPAGFSHGIAAEGRTVYIAGQLGSDIENNFSSADYAPQFDQALANVIAILAEAGGKPEHICRITAYCTDKAAFLAGRADLGNIWRRQMGRHFPTMTMIFVNALVADAAIIELEATAVIPEAE